MDEFSYQFVGALGKGIYTVMSNNQLTIAYEMYYNQHHKAAADLVTQGLKLRRAKNQAWKPLDVFGHLLTSTAGKDCTDWRHDELKWLFDSIYTAANVQHKCEVQGLFAHKVRQAEVGDHAPAQAGRFAHRQRQGIVPDFKVSWGGAGAPVLQDVKIFSHCASNFHVRLFQTDARCTAVDDYASKVPKMYSDKAWRVDRAQNGTTADTRPGPVEQEYDTYGSMQGLVGGPHGEMSAYVKQLVARCAQRIAEQSWRAMGARDVHEAQAVQMAVLRQRIGITAVRAHAELKETRLKQVRTKHGGDLDKQATERRVMSKWTHKVNRTTYFNMFYPDATVQRGELV
jgi:hypothetical protein